MVILKNGFIVGLSEVRMFQRHFVY